MEFTCLCDGKVAFLRQNSKKPSTLQTPEPNLKACQQSLADPKAQIHRNYSCRTTSKGSHSTYASQQIVEPNMLKTSNTSPMMFGDLLCLKCLAD